ncbi:MAG: Coenzyme F420 hydrogenase/dehydrogenase, beta subunit C-terminal domain [Armatimonadota bacterium]
MSRNVCSEGYASPWVCTQCGTCVAVCPTDALSMREADHGCRYPVANDERCVSCGVCAEVCPGPRLIDLANHDRPTEADRVYGALERCGLGWASDEAVRRASSSGGLVTAVLLHLLKSGAIDGAVVTDLGGEGCMPRTRLVRDSEEVAAACGSKYMLTSCAEALADVVSAEDGPFAVVGMPCQVQGVRRAMRASEAMRRNVALCISLFCGGTKDFRYRALLARKMGLDGEHLVRFTFRGEGWPGAISGEDARGEIGSIPAYDDELSAIWRRAALTPPRCLVCDDPLGAAADVVVGDPWHIDDDREGPGRSLFLARTEAGLSAIEHARNGGAVEIDETITHSDVMRSAQGILWRRYYAPSRVRLASLWARGWRQAASEAPRPSLGLIARAARAFVLSRRR